MIEAEPIVTICTADIAGQLRGKGFPARDLEKRRQFGVGWTPTNIMINCFGRIPATPWGAVGDLMLVPDPNGDVRLDYGDGTREHFILGDILNLDGTPWTCCPRSFLKAALDTLEAETGLRLFVAFEHEFHYSGADERPGDSYSVGSLRGVEPFIETYIGALRANGLEPDTFLPEFGPKQFEITVDPAIGVEAADRAVKLREIAHSVARRFGETVSFSPVVTHGIVGNGVHVHFSLLSATGTPATYDAAGPHGLSDVAASFAAGILRHARTICAVTAPSVISYERLKPNSWSAFWTNLGVRDREATLRICPIPAHPSIDVAARYNLEFRAADAAANPYLQLGMLVHAGLAGIRAGLPAPEAIEGNPGDLPAATRERLGMFELPRSLAAALDALESSPEAAEWMGPDLFKAYLMHKRGEIGMLEGKPIEEMCRLYAQVY